MKNIKNEHVPVMLENVLSHFAVLADSYAQNGFCYFIDFTFGLGGHSAALLQKYDWLKVIGMDADFETCEMGRKKYSEYINSGRLEIINGNFVNFRDLIPQDKLSKTGMTLADLGISNYQLLTDGRGFTFDDRTALDMRIDQNSNQETAADVVNKYRENEIADILYEYADEKFSREIARSIIKYREKQPIISCHELAEIVRNVYKRHPAVKMDIDFATRAFMALRIFVNSELSNLTSLLEQTKSCLPAGANILIISFHSKEDKIVKNFMQQESRTCICPPQIIRCICNNKPKIKCITKKIIEPSAEEISSNPRSRSAKLRIFEII